MWICWRCLWNLLQTRGTGAGKKMRSRTFMKMTLCLFLMPPRMKRVIQKYRWMILSAFLELTFIIFLNICWKHTKTDADMKRVTCSKVGRTLPDCRRPVFVLTASAAHFCYFSEKSMTVLKKIYCLWCLLTPALCGCYLHSEPVGFCDRKWERRSSFYMFYVRRLF